MKLCILTTKDNEQVAINPEHVSYIMKAEEGTGTFICLFGIKGLDVKESIATVHAAITGG